MIIMIKNLKQLIKSIFIGNMGIKTVKQADTTLYERQGGYFYITLKNN